MAFRQVMAGTNGFLNLRSAVVHWGEEQGRQGGEGRTVTHLRWMIPAQAGFPSSPFKVWKASFPGGSHTKQELADNLDWGEKPIEIVGLPVDVENASRKRHPWYRTPYLGLEQGIRADGLQSPKNAALRRLAAGAPPRGSVPYSWDGLALPDWKPTDLKEFLASTIDGRLMAELGPMLKLPFDKHCRYCVEGDKERISPALLFTKRAWELQDEDSTRNSFRPMELLCMAASADPLSALALGFGTAFEGNDSEMLYMVTVEHRLRPDGPEIEIADIVRPTLLRPTGLAAPSGLTARRVGFTRPQIVDGQAVESVGLIWSRDPTRAEPTFLEREPAQAIAYAVARFDPATGESALLLEPRRPEAVGGLLSFVPARSAGSSDYCQFNDHVLRGPAGLTKHYAIAAEDLYGRWSDWIDIDYAADAEGPQQPSILSASLTPQGRLTLDFSWDWSSRSPDSIDISYGFTTDPEQRLLRVEFGGNDAAQTEGVVALNLDKKPVGWGSPQDRDPTSPGVRLYRWETELGELGFAGSMHLDLEVRARGRCYLHDWVGSTSEWTVPKITRIWSDARPKAPRGLGLEIPNWASLPDAAGVSRFVLTWPAAKEEVAGYVVYEASETTVLAVLDPGEAHGPDLRRPIAERLTELVRPATKLKVNADKLQQNFRRVTAEPLPAAALSYEVSLPKGSKILHFYSIASVGLNGKESDWPTGKSGYSAVAAPHLATPPRPHLTAAAIDPGRVSIKVGLPAAGGLVELHRRRSDATPVDVDAMGPPVASLAVDGEDAAFEDTPPIGWQKLWYSATVRSRADITAGLISSRSPASAITAVELPPPEAPTVDEVKVNELQSTATESLVSWGTSLPLDKGHMIVVDARGGVTEHFEAACGDIPAVASADLIPVPGSSGAQRFFRSRQQDGDRVYFWLPRQANVPATVTIKMIDPVGRISRLEVNVPAVSYERIGWAQKAEHLRGQNGKRFHFDVGTPAPATLPGVWGTDTYTDDSSIAVAAVHAGILPPTGGRFTIEIRPGQASYSSTSSHGVSSQSWGAWPGSFSFISGEAQLRDPIERRGEHTMSTEQELRAVLSQIASLISGLDSPKTAAAAVMQMHAEHAEHHDEFPSCSIKYVPPRLTEKAANFARKNNPGNAPLPTAMSANLPPEVLSPLALSILTNKYWGPAQRTLTVSFMEPTAPDLRARILQHMNAWNLTAGINFVETAGTGNVRITFAQGGYSSYLGTDIMLIPYNLPTMCLQGFSMYTPEAEFLRVVRHETGHTMGFPHEHMRQALVSRIDPAKAYPFYLANQGWDKAMVDAQVLTPLDEASLMGTPPDQTSIMCYQVPGTITTDGYPIIGGLDINASDYAFAGWKYPKFSFAPGSTPSAAQATIPAMLSSPHIDFTPDWGVENDPQLPL